MFPTGTASEERGREIVRARMLAVGWSLLDVTRVLYPSNLNNAVARVKPAQ